MFEKIESKEKESRHEPIKKIHVYFSLERSKNQFQGTTSNGFETESEGELFTL